MTKLEFAVLDWMEAHADMRDTEIRLTALIDREQRKLKAAKDREASTADIVRQLGAGLKAAADKESIATELIKQLADKIGGETKTE